MRISKQIKCDICHEGHANENEPKISLADALASVDLPHKKKKGGPAAARR